MLELKNPTKKPIVVIRAASGHELSEYAKRKLATIEDNAQENKIEIISVKVNDQKQRLQIEGKEVCIDLGELAFNNVVTPRDISDEELFFIQCALNEAD